MAPIICCNRIKHISKCNSTSNAHFADLLLNSRRILISQLFLVVDDLSSILECYVHGQYIHQTAYRASNCYQHRKRLHHMEYNVPDFYPLWQAEDEWNCTEGLFTVSIACVLLGNHFRFLLGSKPRQPYSFSWDTESQFSNYSKSRFRHSDRNKTEQFLRTLVHLSMSNLDTFIDFAEIKAPEYLSVSLICRFSYSN